MKDRFVSVKLNFTKGDSEPFEVRRTFTIEGSPNVDPQEYEKGETVKGILTRYDEDLVNRDKIRQTGGKCHLSVYGHTEDLGEHLLGTGVVPGEFVHVDKPQDEVFLKVPVWEDPVQ